MKWSYRLGRFLGIDVQLHLTFLLLLGWVGLDAYWRTHSAVATIVSVLLIVALFAIVVLHEYGHALTARTFGIQTRHITLYPIGGMAMLERMPAKPAEQLLIAVAGPAVNFVLAGILGALAAITGTSILEIAEIPRSLTAALPYLFWANIMMGAFNLVPATPLDGGRILRALLALRMPALSAARVATRIGRVVAVLMGLYALLPPMQITFLLIAFFVWFSSGAELAAEERLAASQDASNASSVHYPDGIEVLDRDGRPLDVAGQARPRERIVVQVVDGPFGPRLRFIRLE